MWDSIGHQHKPQATSSTAILASIKHGTLAAAAAAAAFAAAADAVASAATTNGLLLLLQP